MADMDLSSVYEQMEATDVGPGQVFKRVLLTPSLDVVAYVDTQARTRGARLEFKKQDQMIASVEQVRGVRIVLENQSSSAQHLSIEQVRPGDSQLFVLFVADLVKSVQSAPGAESKAAAERIVRWRAFFSRSPEGLTKEEQLGLFAELLILERLARAGVGYEKAVALWEGPHSEVHDFSADSWAMEIKATSSLASGIATINSERQLDPDEVSPLFLVFLGIDVRPHSQGPSLPQQIWSLRKSVAGYPSTADRFEDLLMGAGYIDLHAPLYPSHYEVVRDEAFEVSDDFPSLRKGALPTGVSHTRYALNLDLCQSWRVTYERVFGELVNQA